jgi:hypothetical protein
MPADSIAYRDGKSHLYEETVFCGARIAPRPLTLPGIAPKLEIDDLLRPVLGRARRPAL